MIANANPTDFLSVGKACREFSLSAPTMRAILDANPQLGFLSIGGHRRISRSALMEHLGLTPPTDPNMVGKKVCVMTRISTSQQKTSLVNQKESCLAYCAEHLAGKPIEINASIRSGMAVGHPKFVDFVMNLCNGMYSDVVANHSERICRSGLPLIRKLCEKFEVNLHIVNKFDDKDSDDLVSDILAYTMYYNAVYNSKKSAKLSQIYLSDETKETIQELFKKGLSIKQIYRDLKKNGVLDQKGKEISTWTIQKLLKKSHKLWKKLAPADRPKTTFEEFAELFVKVTGDERDKVLRKTLLSAYKDWCVKNGKEIMPNLKLSPMIRNEMKWNWKPSAHNTITFIGLQVNYSLA